MMFLRLLLAVFVIVTSTAARNVTCGTNITPSHYPLLISSLSSTESSLKLLSLSNNNSTTNIKTKGALPTIDVPIHFHIISSLTKQERVTTAALVAQYKVLKDVYGQYDINMQWDGRVASRTVDSWLSTGSNPQTSEQNKKKREYLTRVRKGSYLDLNYYFYTDMPTGLWGACTLPKPNITLALSDDNFLQDGCDIHADALPNGPVASINKGYTAVHEAGHWLGLLHPFQTQACDAVGDLVEDTPAMSVETTGCPVGKDSCPGLEGLDPIGNYMDYSDDACMTGFTEGQKVRMHALWEMLRFKPQNAVAAPTRKVAGLRRRAAKGVFYEKRKKGEFES